MFPSMQRTKLFAVIVAVGLSTVAQAASPWVYADEGATEANAFAQKRTWGGYCNTGNEQSPINVDTSKLVQAGTLPSITTHFTTNLKYVKNTGHGYQLFETSPDIYLVDNVSGTSEIDALGNPKGYSMIGGQTFNFYQVHWHTPSENSIDGKLFPLEAHFVHQYKDPVLVGSYHKLAVIALLYEMGPCNEFLDQFWGQFPEEVGMQTYTGPEVDFNTKLNDELKSGYYHWYGSLTTPPCTEGVSWNLLHVYETVCQRQLDVMSAALNASQHGIDFNNRVVQPLNHRVVATSDWLMEDDANKEVIMRESESGGTSGATVAAVMCFVIAILIFGVFYALYHIGNKVRDIDERTKRYDTESNGDHAPHVDNTPLLSVQEMLVTVQKEVKALRDQSMFQATRTPDAKIQATITPASAPMGCNTIGKLAGVVCNAKASS